MYMHDVCIHVYAQCIYTLSMYMCVCLCMYVYIYMYIYGCMHLCVCVHICLHVWCVPVYVCVCDGFDIRMCDMSQAYSGRCARIRKARARLRSLLGLVEYPVQRPEELRAIGIRRPGEEFDDVAADQLERLLRYSHVQFAAFSICLRFIRFTGFPKFVRICPAFADFSRCSPISPDFRKLSPNPSKPNEA